MTADSALLAASALHAGFQAVVTVVVYPALVTTPTPAWRRSHQAHSRRIAVVVGPVYLALLIAVAWAVATEPVAPARAVAVSGAAVAVLTTATVAGPAHARLRDRGPEPPLLQRLLWADRLRLTAALVGLAGAAAL